MTASPFLAAPLHIQAHALAALLVLILGPFVILRSRRDRLHRLGGYVWVVAMGFTALSSFAIHSFALIGPFSPIHLLAVLVLWSLWQGMAHAFAGRIRAHEAVFRNLYWRGLIVAGLFNFLPGRVVSRALLPETPELGYAVIVAGAAALVWHALSARRGPAAQLA
ncbi:DUF2306 domain-containing protein [Tropicibacter oceani]|uniref:DUF2306 domain-containing protein n=1 Tax=Tropicibacter oceani TaxID=3058420 RepID=A0ABY8QFF2_9RHOB|nr:DUF2306 domain-containing protein [Tropicibacter oceani]WGW03326.1 DUF2306 domain-containing protein [Tropicibacter oceani]